MGVLHYIVVGPLFTFDPILFFEWSNLRSTLGERGMLVPLNWAARTIR